MTEQRPICTGTSQLFDISMKLKKKWDAKDELIRLERKMEISHKKQQNLYIN